MARERPDDHRSSARALLLGGIGERLAAEHYERLGFAVLERNRRTPSGELDLIVADARLLVFVEVKTASAAALDPLVSLTARKLARTRRAAVEWLAIAPRQRDFRELRFDAVAIVLDERGRLVSLEQFEAIDCGR